MPPALPLSRRPGTLKDAGGDALHTLADLQAGAKESMARLQHAHTSLQAELHDLRAQIPLLVKSIWGTSSEVALGGLRQRGAELF